MAVRLYNLLPFIIRVRDALASGLLEGEQTAEGVLAKLVSCFEEELGVVEEEIRNLTAVSYTHLTLPTTPYV